MAKRSLHAGATSNREYVVIRDGNGSPITGLVFNSSGLIAYYVLPGAASVAISIVTQTVTGAYSSGGFVEIDATHAPGLYRFDIPDAVFAASNHNSVVCLSGFAGMAALYLEYDLFAIDPQDSVRAGLTALPNATAGATNGLPLAVDSSGRVDVLKINGTSQTARDIGASVLLSSGTGTGQVSLSAGKVSGVVLVDTLTTYTGNTVQTGDAYARLGAPTGASVSADVAALKTDLDAGVKVSVGTGVGQINASGGKVPATLATSDVTGTLAVNASQIGGAAVSLDTNNLLKVDVEDWKGAAAAAMTGDAYARLGAPAGLTVSADVASVKSDTSGLRTDYTTARAGYLDTLNGLVAAIWASGTRTLTSFGTVASDAATAVWAAGSRTLTAFGFTVTTDVSSTVTTNLDATVSSRLATSGYTAPPTAAQNASAVLTADWSSINGEAARSLINAARALRNKVVLNAGVITVYKEDGTTVAWTETVTTDQAALPIVSVAP